MTTTPQIDRAAETASVFTSTTPSSQAAVLEAQKKFTVQELYSLKGKFAAVTGGARGLGITLAAALVESDCHVALIDVLPEASPEEFEPLKRLADSKGLSLTYHISNITSAKSINATFDTIAQLAEQLGSFLAVVLNCAGIQQRMLALDYPEDDFRRIIDVNVTGSMLVAQAGGRLMKAHGKGGSIILIASMSGSIANRGLFCTAYNTSKASVLQMARSLAAEWGQYGIRVNTLSPGYIATAMTAALLKDEPHLEKQWTGDNPLNRIGLPHEFKGAAVFLASNASTFCTGSDIRVDGGHTAW